MTPDRMTAFLAAYQEAFLAADAGRVEEMHIQAATGATETEWLTLLEFARILEIREQRQRERRADRDK